MLNVPQTIHYSPRASTPESAVPPEYPLTVPVPFQILVHTSGRAGMIPWLSVSTPPPQVGARVPLPPTLLVPASAVAFL